MSGNLALTSGDLLTGANVLAQFSSATSSGNTDVVGNVARANFTVNSPFSFGNPSNVVTISSGSIANTSIGTQAVGMTSAITSVTINETATPPAVPFVILIGTEQILVTNRTGASNPRTYTLVRAVNGTTAASHANGSAVTVVGQLSAKLVKSAPAGKPNAINRTYTLTPFGTFTGTANLQLHYLDSDLNGNGESTLHLWKLSGSWADQDPTGASTTRDTTNNWVKQTGITGFSDWTLAGDSAAATLVVIKHVINNNGGTASAANWLLTVSSSNGGTGTGSANGAESPGTSYTLQVGKAYSVAESGGPSGYSESDSADCNIASAVSGTTYTCTITNDDVAPTLLVKKHVVTDNGGSAVAANWLLTVSSSNGGTGSGYEAGIDTGTLYTLQAGKAYSVAESGGPSGYSESDSANCNIANAALGATCTCTITNDDVAPTLTVKKHVVTDNGGSAVAANWLLTVSSSNGGTGTGKAAGSEAGTVYTLQPGKA
jgi:hypothetical protein